MSEVVSGVDEARARAWADRPGPAIPLLLLALVVTGALVVGLIRAAQVTVVPDASQPEFGLVSGPMPVNDRVRLLYWVVASIAAYLLALWIARRQGYRGGLWVNRRPLVVAGVLALLGALIIVFGWFAPGDLLIRGNVPLLAIAVGIEVWALRERRPGLWVVAAVIVPVTLLANLYDVENLLFRLGIPFFDNADQIANLGAVAVVLFIASAVFGVLHWRAARSTHARGAQ
jgi:hypothetical protein